MNVYRMVNILSVILIAMLLLVAYGSYHELKTANENFNASGCDAYIERLNNRTEIDFKYNGSGKSCYELGIC